MRIRALGISGTGLGSFYIAATYIQNTEIDAYIDPADKSVTGTWDNKLSTENGTISGNPVTNSAYAGEASGTIDLDSVSSSSSSSSSSSGGGGGSGCFLRSLAGE
ncbi:MAG: hypothetical protein ACOC03_03790 [Desulfosalsimonas sp.]